MRRVVVTGLGLVTPLGGDVETTWQNLIAGKSGIAAITRFDTTGFHILAKAHTPAEHEISVGFDRNAKRKKVSIDGSEVRRLRRKQRKAGLEPEEVRQLLSISEAMSSVEENRMGALVDILGYRFRHRDVPDEVLQPLLDAMTGSKEGK